MPHQIQNSSTTLDPIIGFQVDRVKHAELGEGKVRLTAYYHSSGKVRSKHVFIRPKQGRLARDKKLMNVKHD